MTGSSNPGCTFVVSLYVVVFGDSEASDITESISEAVFSLHHVLSSFPHFPVLCSLTWLPIRINSICIFSNESGESIL